MKLGYGYLIEALELRVAGAIIPCLVDSYAQSLIVPKDHDLVKILTVNIFGILDFYAKYLQAIPISLVRKIISLLFDVALS